MYEYAVIFTYNSVKYAILIKEASSPKEAIKKACEQADKEKKYYTSIEVVICV